MTGVRRWAARVLAHEQLAPDAYLLRVSREELSFAAGQLVTVHGTTPYSGRSYSIASGVGDPHLDLLYRLRPDGMLTPQLVGVRPGDTLDISGPGGEFTVRDPARPLLFLATGTGVAPCRAFLRSHPGLRLTLLHGVRTPGDLFFREEFAAACTYHPCVSSGPAPAYFHGRVTARLASLDLSAEAHVYLCGSGEMFYEARALLAERGIGPDRIFAEAYYYAADA